MPTEIPGSAYFDKLFGDLKGVVLPPNKKK
jgi:hypothetical protein